MGDSNLFDSSEYNPLGIGESSDAVHYDWGSIGASNKEQEETQLKASTGEEVGLDLVPRASLADRLQFGLWANGGVSEAEMIDKFNNEGKLLVTDAGGDHWIVENGRKKLLSVPENMTPGGNYKDWKEALASEANSISDAVTSIVPTATSLLPLTPKAVSAVMPTSTSSFWKGTRDGALAGAGLDYVGQALNRGAGNTVSMLKDLAAGRNPYFEVDRLSGEGISNPRRVGSLPDFEPVRHSLAALAGGVMGGGFALTTSAGRRSAEIATGPKDILPSVGEQFQQEITANPFKKAIARIFTMGMKDPNRADYDQALGKFLSSAEMNAIHDPTMGGVISPASVGKYTELAKGVSSVQRTGAAFKNTQELKSYVRTALPHVTEQGQRDPGFLMSELTTLADNASSKPVVTFKDLEAAIRQGVDPVKKSVYAKDSERFAKEFGRDVSSYAGADGQPTVLNEVMQLSREDQEALTPLLQEVKKHFVAWKLESGEIPYWIKTGEGKFRIGDTQMTLAQATSELKKARDKIVEVSSEPTTGLLHAEKKAKDKIKAEQTYSSLVDQLGQAYASRLDSLNNLTPKDLLAIRNFVLPRLDEGNQFQAMLGKKLSEKTDVQKLLTKVKGSIDSSFKGSLSEDDAIKAGKLLDYYGVLEQIKPVVNAEWLRALGQHKSGSFLEKTAGFIGSGIDSAGTATRVSFSPGINSAQLDDILRNPEQFKEKGISFSYFPKDPLPYSPTSFNSIAGRASMGVGTAGLAGVGMWNSGRNMDFPDAMFPRQTEYMNNAATLNTIIQTRLPAEKAQGATQLVASFAENKRLDPSISTSDFLSSLIGLYPEIGSAFAPSVSGVTTEWDGKLKTQADRTSAIAILEQRKKDSRYDLSDENQITRIQTELWKGNVSKEYSDIVRRAQR